jgi:formylglycine-generating enzyme required for sulfatase activity
MKKSVLVLLAFALVFSAFVASPKASKQLKKMLRNWAEVPEGQAEIAKEKSAVIGFYMLKTEVSNLDYLEFLNTLSGQELSQALPDTTVWSNGENTNASYVNTYFRYPGFRTYPVVGLSYSQAINYCEWLEG